MPKNTYRISPRGSGNIEKHLSESTLKAIGQLQVKKGGLCDQLWEESADLRLEALNTNWIQGIGHGNLDPNDYGGYMVQDAVYCAHVTETIGLAKWKSTGVIQEYLEAEEKHFKAYTAAMFQDWHIAFEGGIKMGSAAQLYGSFEKSVALSMDPVYFLIALLPCIRLWPWLANEIKGLCPGGNNVYQFWIDDNGGRTYWKELQAVIDAHIDKVDVKLAKNVFRTCMQGEVNFFTSAA